MPEAKADLLHVIYERITVAGPSIVAARLTPAAHAHGLALALPYSMPIEGRDEWIAAAARHFA